MEIIAISETPNHNTMKVSLSEPRQDNSSTTYTAAQEGQPESIFYVLDFISIDKEDNANWNELLPQIENTFAKSN